MGRFQNTAFGRRAGKIGITDEAQAVKLAQNRPDSVLGRLYSRAPGGGGPAAQETVEAPAPSAVMGRGRQPIAGGNMVRSDPNRNRLPPGVDPTFSSMPFPEMVAGGGGRSVGMSPGAIDSDPGTIAPPGMAGGSAISAAAPSGAPTLRTLPARIPGGGPEMEALPFGPTPIPGGDLSMDPGMPPEAPSFRRVNPVAIQGLLQRIRAQAGGGATGRPLAEALGGGRPAF